MRLPNLDEHGWDLDDGEQRHAEAPETFWIPSAELRRALKIGDYVKLIFRIGLQDADGATEDAYERMWVVVSRRVEDAYVGRLTNEPTCLDENDRLWSGVEVPFEPRHVIDFQPADRESHEFLQAEPLRRWAE